MNGGNVLKRIICNEDRVESIKRIEDKELLENIDILIEMLKDDSSDVRYNILYKLYRTDNNKIFTYKLLKACCTLILDRSVFVRLLFAKTLKRFKNITHEQKESLFCKNSLGLFIYAVEDEDTNVKKEIIKAMEYFLIPASVNFLIDMLNDDSEDVRIIVSKVLMMASNAKKHDFRIKCTPSQISFILLCLEESNQTIQNNILKVLANIHHEREDLFFYLLRLCTIKEEDKMKALIEMVHNNSMFYSEYLETHLDYIFENNKTLYDVDYLGNLIMLRSIMRISDKKYQLSNKISEDLKFLKFKLRHKNSINTDIKNIINTHPEIIEKQKTRKVLNAKIFDDVVELPVDSKNIINFENGVDDNVFNFIKSYFYNTKDESDKKLKSSSVKMNFLEILKLFYLYKENISIRNMIKLHYFIIGPSEVRRYRNRPLTFKLNVHYKDNKNDIYVFITDGKHFIDYKLTTEIIIVLNEPKVEQLEYFVGVKCGDAHLPLSDIAEIKIVD